MFKPMLANNYEDKKGSVKFPCFVQPKIDGIRLCWDGNNALSRSGKPISGVPLLVKLLRSTFGGVALDGELYVKGLHFEDLNGIVRRTTNVAEDLSIQYWVFDMPLTDMSFIERTAELRKQWVKRTASLAPCDKRRLVLVQTDICMLPEAIERFMDVHTQAGFEGIMVRSANGLYMEKRTNDLLKYKRFKDCEAFIEDFVEGKGKHKGRLGALRCVLVDNCYAHVEVGTGFDDAQRDNIWRYRKQHKSKVITVKYQELTRDGIPRFPVFVRFRDANV